MSFQLLIADCVGPVGQISKKTIQNGRHLPLLKAQLSEALFLFPLKPLSITFTKLLLLLTCATFLIPVTICPVTVSPWMVQSSGSS